MVLKLIGNSFDVANQGYVFSYFSIHVETKYGGRDLKRESHKQIILCYIIDIFNLSIILICLCFEDLQEVNSALQIILPT